MKFLAFAALYLITSIIKLPFGLIGTLLLWIESLGSQVLAYLVEWLGDASVIDDFNAILDTNVKNMNQMAEQWYLTQKIEL